MTSGVTLTEEDRVGVKVPTGARHAAHSDDTERPTIGMSVKLESRRQAEWSRSRTIATAPDGGPVLPRAVGRWMRAESPWTGVAGRFYRE